MKGILTVNSDIRDVSLAGRGQQRIAWAARHMPVLGQIASEFAAEASPAAVMDLSFADQALSAHYLLHDGRNLPPAVYDVPPEIDERVATLKLRALGIRLDALSDAQHAYQASWRFGTA